MIFKKYTSTEIWDESLLLFLYVQIISRSNNYHDISIEQYTSFELQDTDIKAYNQWIEEGMPSHENLQEWIAQNTAQIEAFKKNFGGQFKQKVEIWSDREKTRYYKEKLQASFEFENYLKRLFKEQYNLDLGQFLTPDGQYYEGENQLGIEIKNDTLINKYGNLYIEYAEKSNASNEVYVPSGILKNDKTKYFLVGTPEVFYIFRKQRLVEIYNEEIALKEKREPSSRGIKFKKIATSLGMAYPVANVANETISIETLVNEVRR